MKAKASDMKMIKSAIKLLKKMKIYQEYFIVGA